MIIDCFTFFNEIELLEVRLHTLAPYVDAFILCEGNRTFQGAEKSYIFSESLPLFEAARNHAGVNPIVHGPTGKPLYIVRADLSHLDSYLWVDGDLSPWYREYVQRRKLMYGLNTLSLSPNDRIILSDVDEIPLIAKDLYISFKDAMDIANGAICAWRQDLFYYWVNMRCWDWVGPVSCTWKMLNEQFNFDLQSLREYRHRAPMVIDGGWHFSFLGGADAIKTKIEAFSHAEYRDYADTENIRSALTEGWKHNRDLFHRDSLGMKFELMPDDSHLPAYLRENKDRFKHWWYEGDRERQ